VMTSRAAEELSPDISGMGPRRSTHMSQRRPRPTGLIASHWLTWSNQPDAAAWPAAALRSAAQSRVIYMAPVWRAMTRSTRARALDCMVT
jgi:hypothetical protein